VTCDFSGSTVNVSSFIDAGSIEVFLKDGAATLSALITAPITATGFQLNTAGGTVRISNVKVAKPA
jgi:levanbiose-producing levanase